MGMILPGCTKRVLTRGEARDALVQIPGLPLPKDNVLIQKVSQLDNTHAVVEADLTVAFQMERIGNRWIASQMRLDKGKWVKVEDLQQDIEKSRRTQTVHDLHLVALALERYRNQKGDYPETCPILQLTNTLFPHYLSRMVFRDAWDNDFIYRRENPRQFQLLSCGPDGKSDSPDDFQVGNTQPQ